MKTDNVIREMSFAFAIRVVDAYKYLIKEKQEFVMSKPVVERCYVYTLRLIDVIGRFVVNEKYTSGDGENQFELNLSTIPKGIYVVQLQSGTGNSYAKVILE